MKIKLSKMFLEEAAESGQPGGGASTSEGGGTVEHAPENDLLGDQSSSVGFSIDDIERILSGEDYPSKGKAEGQNPSPATPKGGDGNDAGDPGKSEAAAPEGTVTPSQNAPVPGATPTSIQDPKAGQGEPGGSANVELELLRQQNQALMETLKTLQNAQETQGAQKGADGDASKVDPDAPKIPEYKFDIPAQLMQLLDSENPTERTQGIGYLVQGVAQTIHSTLAREMYDMRAKLLESMPNIVETMLTEFNQAQSTTNDFYSTYPQFNKPELKPFIESVAMQVAQELGVDTWSPQLRDAIAQRATSILGGGFANPASNGAAGKGTVVPPSTPPQMVGGGSSNSGSARNTSPGNPITNQILDLNI